MEVTLQPFDIAHGTRVRTWAEASGEFSSWASPPTLDEFRAVLADPEIRAYLLQRGSTPIAYAELWIESDSDEVELARIIVDPHVRNRGVGTALVNLLLQQSRSLPGKTAWVRVEPRNAAALACYAKVGFVRTSVGEELTFNERQPRAYQWLKHPI